MDETIKKFLLSPTLWVLLGVVLLVYILINNLQRLGIIQNPEVKKAKEEKEIEQLKFIKDEVQTFKSKKEKYENFFQSVPKNPTITLEKAREISDSINDTFGFFNDDETELIKIITSIKSADNLQFVAQEYQKQYGNNLGSVLNHELNEMEFETVFNHITNL